MRLAAGFVLLPLLLAFGQPVIAETAFSPQPQYRTATPDDYQQEMKKLAAEMAYRESPAYKAQQFNAMAATVLVGLAVLAIVWFLVSQRRKITKAASDKALDAMAAGLRVKRKMDKGAARLTEEVRRRADDT